MLALRFGLMDDVFGAHFHAAAATATAPLQLRAGLAPCVSPEWCGAQTSTSKAVGTLGACCSDVFTSAACDPAMDDGEEQDSALGRMATARNATPPAPSFAFDDNEDFDEDFDLGPPPPSGPVLVRQRAMDWTVAHETKVAALAQKLDATPSSAAALRSTRLIPPSSSSAVTRSRRFMGV